MVDGGAGADQLRLGVVLAVIDHQREIDIAVGQMPRDVAARAPGPDLAEAVHRFVEPGHRFEVGHLQRDVVDARHSWPPDVMHAYAAVRRKRSTPLSSVRSISPSPSK